MKVLLFTLLCSVSLMQGVKVPPQIKQEVAQELFNLNLRLDEIRLTIWKTESKRRELDLFLPALEKAQAARKIIAGDLSRIKNIDKLMEKDRFAEKIANLLTAYNNKKNKRIYYTEVQPALLKDALKFSEKRHHEPRSASAPAIAALAIVELESTSEESDNESPLGKIGGYAYKTFVKKFHESESCRSVSAPTTMIAYNRLASESIDNEEAEKPYACGALGLLFN